MRSNVRIQNHDIVASLHPGDGHALKQMAPGGHLIVLREGPFTRAAAEAHALEFAEREQSDALIEEARDLFRCLNA